MHSWKSFRSGDALRWLRIYGVVNEIYDVSIIRGVICPIPIGVQSDEVQRVIRVGPPAEFDIRQKG